MNVKIRPANLPEIRRKQLDKVAVEYIESRIEGYTKELQWRMTRRVIAGVCLMLSDQYDFDSDQCQAAVEGLCEILSGVAEDVYDRGEIEAFGADKMVDNMLLELSDRGIEIALHGDPLYDDLSKIKERKEKAALVEEATKGGKD